MVSASTFPNLDADLYVPALLEGVLGSRSWDGTPWRCRRPDRSAAKASALRSNGKRGGRPRKLAAR